MRREIPVIAIRKGDPDLAPKVLLVNGPAAFELDLPKIRWPSLAILSAKDEIYPVIVDWEKRIVPALHGERDKALAIDDFNNLACGLRRCCFHVTH